MYAIESFHENEHVMFSYDGFLVILQLFRFVGPLFAYFSSPESTSEPSLTQGSNEMASRLYSSTPVSVPGRRFRQPPEPGSDPRVPPGKSVSYLHNFSAGCRKPHVIDGLHSAPLTHGVTSDHEETD